MSDANYVQCIHTNSGVLGEIPSCGCHDFLVNSAFLQPGSISPIYAHLFAYKVFDWTLAEDHKCYSTEGNQLLGIHNTEQNCGTYRVITAAEEPYCPAV